MMCRISKVVCLSVGDKSRSWGRRAGRGDEEVEEKGGGEGGAEVDRDEEEMRRWGRKRRGERGEGRG